MNIKLIVCDIDGTLTDHESRIPRNNILALRAARNSGIRIALCSGRQAADMELIAEILGMDDIFILSLNGSYCLEAPKGKLYYNRTLDTHALWKCISCFEEKDLAFNCFSGNVLINNITPEYEKDPTFWNAERQARRKLITHLYGMEPVRHYAKIGINKLTYVDLYDFDKLRHIKDEMRTIQEVDITSSWRCNFEIMPKGVHKGSAVSALATRLGIEKEQILAFGDNENDIPLFCCVKHSVCMENGTEEAKRNARHLTLSNENAGIAYFLNKNVL